MADVPWLQAFRGVRPVHSHRGFRPCRRHRPFRHGQPFPWERERIRKEKADITRQRDIRSDGRRKIIYWRRWTDDRLIGSRLNTPQRKAVLLKLLNLYKSQVLTSLVLIIFDKQWLVILNCERCSIPRAGRAVQDQVCTRSFAQLKLSRLAIDHQAPDDRQQVVKLWLAQNSVCNLVLFLTNTWPYDNAQLAAKSKLTGTPSRPPLPLRPASPCGERKATPV